MLFRQLLDRESGTYTYLLGCEIQRQAALIDPVKEQLGLYLTLLEQLNYTLVAAIDTHVHADHITALGALRQASSCATYVGAPSSSPCASQIYQEGEIIQIGEIALKAWHTPGHTDDSYSLVLADRVFTGDCLLIRGTGRVDFQNGNALQQYASLQRLLTLPDETLVYAGHDYKGWTVSTIGEERQHNPRLQVRNAEEYAALMRQLNLPNPKMMDVAVPANRACGQILQS